MTGKELVQQLEKLRLNHTEKKSEQIIEVSSSGSQIRFASVNISSETPKILYHTTNTIKHDNKESCFCEIGALIKVVSKASSPSFMVTSDSGVIVKDVLKIVGEIKTSGYQLQNSRSYDFFEYMRSVSGDYSISFEIYGMFFSQYVFNKENNTILYADNASEIMVEKHDYIFEHFVVGYTKNKETGYTKLKADFTLLNTLIETAKKSVEGKLNLISINKDNSVYGSFDSKCLLTPLQLCRKFPTDDALKPNMQYAVLFNECGKSMCYASDSHVLIRYTMDIELSDSMCEKHPKIGFHSTTIDILTKVLKDTHTVNIYGDNGLYAVVSEWFVVYFRQVTGRYVDYRSVITNSCNVSFKMDTAALAVIGDMNTDSGAFLVKFILNEKYIQTISEDIDYSTYTRVTSEISDYVNETGMNEIGFNYKYLALLADTLSKARIKNFTMSLNSPERPAYIKADNILLLIMPMLLTS